MQALNTVADRINAQPSSIPNRSLTCTISDLDAVIGAQLVDGKLIDIAETDDPTAKIRLIVSSDDLVAMADGSLNAASAFGSGRLKVKASFGDLLLLRKLF
jgi:putative sterol carrier protein